MTIRQLPETERPYEKLELHGESALSDAELLAIIIKTGTKEETSVQLAQKILKLNETKQFGMNFLKDITIEELIQIKGIGKVKAIQLKAVGELAIRMSKPSNYRKIIIKDPHDVISIVMEELRFEKREIAKLLILSEINEVLKIKDISLGGNSFVNFCIKDVLTEAIRMKATKIILVHNHPSGDATASEVDIKFTKSLYDIGILLGIELVDHIVIGNGTFTSIFSQIAEEEEKKKTKQKEGKDRGK